MKSSRKITRSEKKLFLITGFALIFIIAFGAWRQWVNAIPEVTVPKQNLPSPNAYDFYVKAGAAMVPDNAAVEPIHDVNTVPKSQWKIRYPTTAKEAWLRRNATTLKLLRQGSKYPYRVPHPRTWSISISRNYSNLRGMARMLAIESHAHGERGNWSAAANSALDISELGHHVSHGGVLLDYLVGVAINAIGQRELWEILPHLKESEAKLAVRRLEKIAASRASFADVLRREKIYHQAGLAESMRSGSWEAMSWGGTTRLERLNERWQILKTPRRTVFNNYSKYMEALISEAEKPYHAKADIQNQYDDFYNQMVIPVFERTHLNHVRDAAGNDLLLVALALHAYNLENRHYPQTLAQLVPGYLKKIPADPYREQNPLSYKLSGKKYCLSSVGPDGLDNHGRPIEHKSRTGRGRYLVFDEEGDYVAGINH